MFRFLSVFAVLVLHGRADVTLPLRADTDDTYSPAREAGSSLWFLLDNIPDRYAMCNSGTFGIETVSNPSWEIIDDKRAFMTTDLVAYNSASAANQCDNMQYGLCYGLCFAPGTKSVYMKATLQANGKGVEVLGTGEISAEGNQPGCVDMNNPFANKTATANPYPTLWLSKPSPTKTTLLRQTAASTPGGSPTDPILLYPYLASSPGTYFPVEAVEYIPFSLVDNMPLAVSCQTKVSGQAITANLCKNDGGPSAKLDCATHSIAHALYPRGQISFTTTDKLSAGNYYLQINNNGATFVIDQKPVEGSDVSCSIRPVY